jgi:hypothetical protein
MEGKPMCFVISFIPATIWTVIGYFVFFSSTKTEVAVRKFGQVLAIWIFIIALFFPIMGAYVSVSGLCPIEEIIQTMTP